MGKGHACQKISNMVVLPLYIILFFCGHTIADIVFLIKQRAFRDFPTTVLYKQAYDKRQFQPWLGGGQRGKKNIEPKVR